MRLAAVFTAVTALVCICILAGVPGNVNAESNTIDMVLIEPGVFQMGSADSEQDRDKDEVQHEVKFTRAFYLSKYEVTQDQWKKVMDTNPSHFKNCGDQCPVDSVSWYDAVEFCNKLSDSEGLTHCYKISGDKVGWDQSCTGYRLPSESEWEYAARAGTQSAFACGDSASCLGDVAWFADNSDNTTHQVGTKKANAWGLYDMHGNVVEWVWDYSSDYPTDAQVDPVGSSAGTFRVGRGGASNRPAKVCRSANRGFGPPENIDDFLGFRVARTAPSQ